MRRVFRVPFSRDRISRDVDEELSFHFHMRIQRLVESGMPYDDARHEALRQFGDVASVRDSMVTMDTQRERATRRATMLSELHQDIAYALRTLKRNIGFTAVVVIALAVGIGANTAIFTLVDAILLRTLPVSHPEQLVEIGDPTRVGSRSAGSPRTEIISAPLYRDIRNQTDLFTGVLASGRVGRIDVRIDDTKGGDLEHPRSRFVSGNYFEVLGVKPAIGRTLDASMDDVAGGAPAITISYGYWTSRFHSDPSVVGKNILINGTRYSITGVAAEGFTGDIVGQSPDMWIPLMMQDVLHPNQKMLDSRNENWLLLLARLKPGVTLGQVQKALPAIMDRMTVANTPPQVSRDFMADKRKYIIGSGAKGFSRVRDTFQAPLITLMAGVALLLCIICVNVANLLLARAVARGREMSVRLALGADRSRLVRQLLTESAVLAVLAAVAGLLVAWWGGHALLALASEGQVVPIRLALDLPVLGFTLVVSVLAVGLFGLAPALRASRVDLASTMRAGSRSVATSLGGGGSRVPLGSVLVTGQVALSVILLVGAMMLVRSLRNLQSTDVGVDRDHLIIADLDINANGIRGAALATLVRDLSERTRAIPGVAAVTYSENGIFSGSDNGASIEVPGFVARAPDDTVIQYDDVGPGYFAATGARVIAGRGIEPQDENRLPRTMVVNQSLATFYFPGESAIGKYLHFGDTVAVQIVGVIADTRDHEIAAAPQRRAYFAYLHTPDATVGEPATLRLIVRTSGDPSTLVQRVRETIRATDPRVVIDSVDPLQVLMAQTISEELLVARLATGFGVLALLLAAIGLYGVMTYAITRRTGEIGLRVALGAQRGDVITMVLKDALVLVAMGVVIGLPLAIAAMHGLGSQLHDLSAADPVSIAVSVSVLAVSAVIAVLIPAMRASRVSPIVALRAE